MPASPTLTILPNAVVGVWLTAASSSTSAWRALTRLSNEVSGRVPNFTSGPPARMSSCASLAFLSSRCASDSSVMSSPVAVRTRQLL